ncbi:MAG TPA: sigma 54-interacting transcriptional regulator [Kofleriaceae bacterium]|nr:sigma 54-interacting transcriptional regulator [Kofleriaceae bacterium]
MVDTAGITLSLNDRASARTDGPVRTPHLVVALESSRPAASSARHSLAGVHTVHLGRASARRSERFEDGVGRKLRIGIPDRWMSSAHARIEHSFGRWVLEDAGSKNGTIVNGNATQRAVLQDGDVIELGHTLFLFLEGLETRPDEAVDVDLADHGRNDGLLTLIPALGAQFERLEQIAASPIAVLIQGASGTGKEVLARAVHDLSGRRGEFVAVNCGAIPANLVESELFGYRKGAFSGAVEDRPGLIRTADKGTLFLDEIGDLPPASQAALLRVLQEREVTPIGGAKPVPVDIRVVAATHRDLDAMVEREEFRRDLFARLAGYRLTLPRLAERRADLGLLISSLLGRTLGDPTGHPGFESEAARCLFAHDWPLNIRELEQCLRTALVLAGQACIDVEHLPEGVRSPQARDAGQGIPAQLSPEDIETRDSLLAVLRTHRGNISAVARAMGKDRKQIQRWVKRFDLDPTAFR